MAINQSNDAEKLEEKLPKNEYGEIFFYKPEKFDQMKPMTPPDINQLRGQKGS